jgi:hypothetical protein
MRVAGTLPREAEGNERRSAARFAANYQSDEGKIPISAPPLVGSFANALYIRPRSPYRHYRVSALSDNVKDASLRITIG